MASRELAILVKAKGALQAAGQIGKVDGAVSKLGRTAARGVRTATGNIARLGLVAAGGVAVAVKGGIDSLAELETATTSVDGAIKQLGLTGRLTGAQVAGWANDIEAAVGRAFDDKEITAAAATLLRFGKVAPANLRPAMEVMTDLATKTGSVDSAASLLAKALADPTKAAGKLARSGVILTKAQQKQIASLVKTGKVAQAQKLILDALAKTTKGAALASQGPYARALATLADVSEDAKRALAEGFLPVIQKTADFLSTKLADKGVMDSIRAFGQDLANGFDQAIEFGKTVPWGMIGDSLKTAGAGAKAMFDAFTGLPPWVQTAVVTGWGLNKLTGGALGDLFGQTIKLALGNVFARGSSPANPMWVKSLGGGVGGAGGKGGGILPGIGTLLSAGVIGAMIPDVLKAMGLDDPVLRAINERKTGPVHTDAEGNRVGAVNRLGFKSRTQGMSPDERQAATDQKRKIDQVRAAMNNQGNRIVAALNRLDLSVTVPVTVKVSGGTITKTTGSTLLRIGGNAAAGALAGM